MDVGLVLTWCDAFNHAPQHLDINLWRYLSTNNCCVAFEIQNVRSKMM